MVLLFFCEKEDTDENKCPVVAANAVPQTVKDLFNVRYPATTVITRLNKDNIGFCAFFKTSGTEKLTQKVRYPDKPVNEPAKGKKTEKIMRGSEEV